MTTTTRTGVVVAGGGPVGILVAALLAAEGVDVVVLERRAEEPSHSRAIGVHPPSLDVLDRIDAAAPLLARAVRVRCGVARSRGRTLGTLAFDRVSRTHPYVATAPQHVTESVLRDRLEALAPGALHRGWTVTDVTQDDDGTTVTATGPAGERARWAAPWVVAADGPRSTVRDLLGVPTTGRAYPDRYVMGDFADPGTANRDTAVVDVGPFGVVESFPLPGGTRRFVVHTPWRDLDAAGLAGIVAARTGTTPDPASCTMLSAFGVRRRAASRMVHGRVVLVGDAAHEISPIGGQGMNLGWLDAAAVARVVADAVRSGGTVRAGVPADVAGALALVDRTRMRSARVAARQAELNTAAGRPARGVALGAREALLATLLRSPASEVLARVYAMRFA